MRPRLIECEPWNFVLAVPDEAERKRPAMRREEDHNNEGISVTGSTSSATDAAHSVVLNSRMERRTQPFDFDCSCKFKKQLETLSLFPETAIPTMKKEPAKQENQNKKEIDFADRGKKDKEVPVSGTHVMPMKRKTPEAEEKRDISVDLTLSLGSQSENKEERTAEISPPLGANKEVSTELTLFDQTWPTENGKPYVKELSEVDMKEREVARKIAAMKNYKPGEEEEEKRKGVSTKLELYLDPWIFKKKLTPSDLGLPRLFLRTSFVKKHVYPLMARDIVNVVRTMKGLDVVVRDQDTDSLHHLVFKQLHTFKSYVLKGRWVHDFVNRRNLKEGDEIGMYWDPSFSRFNFCVLNRAPTIQPAAGCSGT